ncbi:MAG: HD domain-containing protein [Mycobacterium sp.]|nr:HD domain-containing protein [Mycobacterium sp.]
MSVDSTLAVVGRLGRAQLEQTMRRAARRLGVDRPEPVLLDTVAIPDSPVAVEAANVLSAQAPTVLAAHSYRAYLFGGLLGTRDGLDWDPELLFLAAMLHDLGLTEFLGGEGPFEQRGAAAAHSWLQARGWPEDRASIVADAIRIHLDVGRAGRERPEIALLHFGTAADVTGMRIEDIHPETVAEVIDAYPRQGFKRFSADKIRSEVRSQPRSATAALCRWGQFPWRISHSPFPE